MKYIINICFIYVTLFSTVGTASSPIARQYVAKAIQGNLSGAPALFEKVGSNSTSADQELADRFRRRFIERSEPLRPASGSALVDEIAFLYRQYWSQALMQPSDRTRLEIDLAASLALLANAQVPEGTPQEAGDDVYSVLRRVLQNRGFHALFDTAPPLQDMLIWRRQRRESFTVRLTDQTTTVDVVFMTEFVDQGWKNFATLGLATTSGWVEEGTLFCLSDAYTADSEAFQVSYLKHESRHLRDLERYPGLTAPDLEYRAKLTELAFADKTLRSLLDDFTDRSADNRSSPHALANHRVTTALWSELNGSAPRLGEGSWTVLDVAEVNRAARRLLKRHTQRLSSPRADW